MPDRLLRRLALLTILLALLGVASPAVATAANGRLGKGELASIYNGPISGHAYLNRPAAAAFNSLNLCAYREGGRLYPTGRISAYRSYGGQVELYALYKRGAGALAAYPGTSNHGLGRAIDLPTSRMQTYIRRRGPPLGWKKIEAFSEPWHFNYVGGSSIQDPTASVTYPVLSERSGRCTGWYVNRAKAHLGRHRTCAVRLNGAYSPGMRRCVIRFQATHRLAGDGVIGAGTWRALRKPRR